MEGKTVKLQIVSIDITDIYIHSYSDLASWFVSGSVLLFWYLIIKSVLNKRLWNKTFKI